MSLKSIYACDVARILRDVGSVVTYNGRTTHGLLLHEPSEVMGLDSRTFSVQDSTLTLTIPTDSLGPLKASKAGTSELIQVDGTTYKIDRFVVLGMGAETKVWVSGVNS